MRVRMRSCKGLQWWMAQPLRHPQMQARPTQCYTTPSHTMPYHVIPYHILLCHSIPYHPMPYHAMPYHTIPYHTTVAVTAAVTAAVYAGLTYMRPHGYAGLTNMRSHGYAALTDIRSHEYAVSRIERPGVLSSHAGIGHHHNRRRRRRHFHTIPSHAIPYYAIPYHTIPYHTIPYHTCRWGLGRAPPMATWPGGTSGRTSTSGYSSKASMPLAARIKQPIFYDIVALSDHQTALHLLLT